MKKGKKTISVIQNSSRLLKNYIYIYIYIAILLANISTTPLIAVPTVINLTSSAMPVKFEKFELTFDLTSEPSNPYDPNIYSVYAIFISPSGKTYRQNAFYHINASGTCTAYGNEPSPREKIETVTLDNNNQHWKIRFAPQETGAWTYRIYVSEAGGKPSITKSYTFNPLNSNNHGFIQVANNRYMKFSDGTPYYPVGLSYPWFDRTPWRGVNEYGTCEVKQVIDKMVLNGVNFFRFEINFTEALNLIGYDFRDGTNYLKYFNQKDSWQLDEIMDYAKEKGIYIQFALISHAMFSDDNYGLCMWKDYNPFNANVAHPPLSPDTSGTCTSPLLFYTDVNAIQIMKNLSRYIIARWGYSTNLMGIELMDEADRFDELNKLNECNTPGWVNPMTPTVQAQLNTGIISWHQTMKAYFDEIDPFNHPITTAYANYMHTTRVSVFNVMDYTTAHNYYDMAATNSNFEKNLSDVATYYTAYYISPSTAFSKPFIEGETYPFSGDWTYGRTVDPHYYCMHAALWSSLFNGSFGTASNWTAQDMLKAAPDAFSIYTGPSTFVSQMPLLSEQFNPAYGNDVTRDVVYLENINKDRIYGYIQDKNFKINTIYHNTAYRPYLLNYNSTYRPPLASSVQTIEFSILKAGLYKIIWYNTQTGIQQSVQYTNSYANNGNHISITVPLALLNGKYGDAAFTISYECDSHWNTGVLNNNSSQIIRSYSPAAFDNSANKVYFIGTDNRIHEMYRVNDTYWYEGTLNTSAPQNVHALSDLATDNQGKVYYTGTDMRIHMMSWNGTAWIESTLNSTAPANVAIYSALQVNGAGTEVFYIGSDNRIHEMSLSGSTWTESTLNASAPNNVMIKSDLVLDETNNRIFFVATDARIHAMSKPGSFWTEGALNSSAPQTVRFIYDFFLGQNVANSSMALDKTNGSIFFVSSDNRVHEYYKNGFLWIEAALNVNAPANVRNGTADNRFSLTSDQHGKVYFTANDNKIHQYYWNGTVWQEATNNVLDNSNVMSGLCSDNNGVIYFAGFDLKIYSSYWSCNPLFKNTSINNSIDKKDESTIIANTDEVLSIYPNPASDILNILIQNQNDIENMDVLVLDLSGRIIINEVSTKNTQVDISKIPVGAYIVKVRFKNIIKRARFFKK